MNTEDCSFFCNSVVSIISQISDCFRISIIILALIFIYIIYYYLYSCKKLSIYCSDTEFSRFVLKNTPELTHTTYKPTPYLLEGDLHTLFAEIQNKRLRGNHGFDHVQEFVKLEDGGQISLDWPIFRDKQLNELLEKNDNPIIVIFPGLTGGCDNSYVGTIVWDAAKLGYKCVILNKRGCSNTPLLVFFHSFKM